MQAHQHIAKTVSRKHWKCSTWPWQVSSHISHTCTVKPVFKGHCDEGTPCDQGTLSQNGVLSAPCQGTCDEGTPVM